MKRTTKRRKYLQLVPGSIIDNTQSLELATRVVIFDNDYGVKTTNNNTSDDNESGATFLIRILPYLETPQYLRKDLFPKHNNLRFVGMLPLLDAPHHLRKHEWSPYREGVTLKERAPNSEGSLVDVGFSKILSWKHTEGGMVQKVVSSSDDEGKRFCCGISATGTVRSPCLGDKFSSMHGQKGVLGFLESQEDFPFTIQGVLPDIVINPRAFPSRQTPGQLLEAALGKGIACDGSMRYATPFSTLSVDVITEQLHRAGFSNGEMRRLTMAGLAKWFVHSFMGPTFYQRLIHMAEDKVKFCNTGPVYSLT